MSWDYGDRIEENKCIRCGADLVTPPEEPPKWHMCTECIKLTQEHFVKMRARKEEDKDTPQRRKMWIPMLARKK
jgi:hypothetical protein